MAIMQTGKPTSNGGNNSETNAAPTGNAPAMVVPFVRASDENLQPGNIDVQRLLTAGAQDLGVMDIPAYGYFRWLYIMVEGTGGTGTGAVLTEDGPWNVLQNIALTEPNGSFHTQFSNGYQLYLANKWGGYVHPVAADPESSPVFSPVSAAGNFKFVLRLPVEVSARDGVAAQANQDSAGQFKFRATLAPSATLFATPPNLTLPTIRVRAWLSSWDQPEPTSSGVGNEVEPPATGTTQFWSVQSGITVNAGENTIELKRKGNYLRGLIFVYRTAAGSRASAEASWPQELRFMRDSFPTRYLNFDIWRHQMFERTGYTGTQDAARGLDNGVRVHDYMHEFSGALGFENRDLWQPTRGSTRLEIAGNFGAAGTLDIITNDVAVADTVFI
jgi:hypothetical protein